MPVVSLGDTARQHTLVIYDNENNQQVTDIPTCVSYHTYLCLILHFKIYLRHYMICVAFMHHETHKNKQIS